MVSGTSQRRSHVLRNNACCRCRTKNYMMSRRRRQRKEMKRSAGPWGRGMSETQVQSDWKSIRKRTRQMASHHYAHNFVRDRSDLHFVCRPATYKMSGQRTGWAEQHISRSFREEEKKACGSRNTVCVLNFV